MEKYDFHGDKNLDFVKELFLYKSFYSTKCTSK